MHIALFQDLPSGGAKRAVHEWARRLVSAYDARMDIFSLSWSANDFCDTRPFVRRFLRFDFRPHPLFRSPLERLNRAQRYRYLAGWDRIGWSIDAEIDSPGNDLAFANPCMFICVPALLAYTSVPSVYYLYEPFEAGFRRDSQRTRERT